MSPGLAAENRCDHSVLHPFYVGVSTGFGSTTWGHLVPSEQNLNDAMRLSTPIGAQEGGALWGVVMGYELIRFFGLELEYVHYPNAQVLYDVSSLFAFEHEGLSDFTTKTETLSLTGKFMVYLPFTSIRVFSSAGPAFLHREDMIENRWIITPIFGLGINYNFTEHIMAEFRFTYTSGFGESELNPAEDYMPFLYAGLVTLSYRF